MKFNSVEEALQELKKGKIILVTDDPDRENEGDFICAAEFATTENINFMATHGKGLICMPMSEEYVKKLNLPPMTAQNTDNHETAFTVSIDYIGTKTGISAEERGMTARACVSEDARPDDFRRPGHMFPLLAKPNGVLERDGHTEATVDLCRLAGLHACGLCCEIMREDGTMMRTTELRQLAEKWGITFMSIKELQNYRKCHDHLVDKMAEVIGHVQKFIVPALLRPVEKLVCEQILRVIYHDAPAPGRRDSPFDPCIPCAVVLRRCVCSREIFGDLNGLDVTFKGESSFFHAQDSDLCGGIGKTLDAVRLAAARPTENHHRYGHEGRIDHCHSFSFPYSHFRAILT